MDGKTCPRTVMSVFLVSVHTSSFPSIVNAQLAMSSLSFFGIGMQDAPQFSIFSAPPQSTMPATGRPYSTGLHRHAFQIPSRGEKE
jgi:hypothetical protein